jgi:peptide deformylase
MMAVLPISHFPDDRVLRQKAKKVPAIDASIERLINNMIETMQQARGVGLAAPQVGVSLRVIVLQMPGEEPIALINPEIVETAGEQTVTEGCLSVPGFCGQIRRPAEVVVKAKDRCGKATRIKASGLMAEALEHEIDHLNGMLYIDHVKVPENLREIEPLAPREQQPI